VWQLRRRKTLAYEDVDDHEGRDGPVSSHVRVRQEGADERRDVARPRPVGHVVRRHGVLQAQARLHVVHQVRAHAVVRQPLAAFVRCTTDWNSIKNTHTGSIASDKEEELTEDVGAGAPVAGALLHGRVPLHVHCPILGVHVCSDLSHGGTPVTHSSDLRVALPLCLPCNKFTSIFFLMKMLQ
jgi:hypothetical protein